MQLLLHTVQCYFPKRKTENHPVRDTFNGVTHGTVLFSPERVKLKINGSKLALTVHQAQRYFQKKDKTTNHQVKGRVNGTQGKCCSPKKE